MDYLSTALARQGLSVSVLYARGAICESRPYAIEEFGTLVAGSSVNGSMVRYICFALALALKLRQLLRTADCDVVHFHTTLAACLGLNVARRYQVPVVYSFHSPLINFVDVCREQPNRLSLRSRGFRSPMDVSSRLLESYAMHHVQKVVTPTATMKTKVVDYFGIAPSMIEVIPTGADSELFRPDVQNLELRQELGLGDDTSVIMCVASIHRRKNQLTLVKAMARVSAAIPDITTVLVGRITDPSYFAEIQDYMQENDLQNRVMFTGHIDPKFLPQYYNLCDVFVLPSLAENLPAVLLEAMSCHRAIVASDLPQYAEVAKTGNEFLVVDPLDPGAISHAVLSILTDGQLGPRMGDSAGETVTEFYDWVRIGKKTIALYEQLQGVHSV